MSDRLHFADICEHLRANGRTFNAPYGVIEGTGVSKSGRKHKSITFGVARHLDAHLQYYSPKFILVQATGALAPRIDGVFHSIEELIAALKNL